MHERERDKAPFTREKETKRLSRERKRQSAFHERERDTLSFSSVICVKCVLHTKRFSHLCVRLGREAVAWQPASRDNKSLSCCCKSRRWVVVASWDNKSLCRAARQQVETTSHSARVCLSYIYMPYAYPISTCLSTWRLTQGSVLRPEAAGG